MAEVKIFSDSTCDLSPDLIEKYGIGIVPLYVTLGEESYKDGEEIGVAEIYRYVDEHKSLPKTAAATSVDFIEAFTPYVAEGPGSFLYRHRCGTLRHPIRTSRWPPRNSPWGPSISSIPRISPLGSGCWCSRPPGWPQRA